jgi:hypothetical protein
MYNKIAVIIVNTGNVIIVLFLEEMPNSLKFLRFLQYIKFGFINSTRHIIII